MTNPIEHRCPYCGAKPGVHCRKTRGGLHPERIFTAELEDQIAKSTPAQPVNSQRCRVKGEYG